MRPIGSEPNYPNPPISLAGSPTPPGRQAQGSAALEQDSQVEQAGSSGDGKRQRTESPPQSTESLPSARNKRPKWASSPPKKEPAEDSQAENVYRNPKLETTKQGNAKQYTLNGKPMYAPYEQTSVNKDDKERLEIGRGSLHTILKRRNPNSSVYLKVFRPEERENPESVVYSIDQIKSQAEIQNEIAELMLEDTEETAAMRKHFAVDVLKEIRDDVPIFYTPVVNGFNMEQYLETPDHYRDELPPEKAIELVRELKNAVQWLGNTKGYAHTDLDELGNIMYDKDNKTLVLIDFENCERLDADEDVRKAQVDEELAMIEEELESPLAEMARKGDRTAQ